MKDGHLLTIPRREARIYGLVLTIVSLFLIGLNVHSIQTENTYYPKSLLLSSLFLPISLFMLIAPGEPDALTGRRSKAWERSLALVALVGTLCGFYVFYQLGGFDLITN